jgi:hypothetical protein
MPCVDVVHGGRCAIDAPAAMAPGDFARPFDRNELRTLVAMNCVAIHERAVITRRLDVEAFVSFSKIGTTGSGDLSLSSIQG